ncbi:MAG: hypothetical protein Q9184_007931 [Pyrenodesmia sp. 2 TL-2023]
MAPTTLKPFTLGSVPPTDKKPTMFHSLFGLRTAKPNNANTRPESSLSGSTVVETGSTSSSSTTRIPTPNTQLPLFKHNLRIYRPSPPQTAFCLPSCPIEEEEEGGHPHNPGLFRHKGKSNNALSFLFGAQNPPPDIWLAHERLMQGIASEDEEELILAFLAHHPFEAGNVGKGVWFAEEGGLRMMGNPLSWVEPEVEAVAFERVGVKLVTEEVDRLIGDSCTSSGICLVTNTSTWLQRHSKTSFVEMMQDRYKAHGKHGHPSKQEVDNTKDLSPELITMAFSDTRKFNLRSLASHPHFISFKSFFPTLPGRHKNPPGVSGLGLSRDLLSYFSLPLGIRRAPWSIKTRHCAQFSSHLSQPLAPAVSEPCRQFEHRDPHRKLDSPRTPHPALPTRRGSRQPYTLSSAIMPPPTSNPCNHPSCPLRFPHSRGVYLHLNQPARYMDLQPSFGASNPPPEVHAARTRLLDGEELEGDRELVMGFCAAHFLEWTPEQRIEFDHESWVQRAAQTAWLEMEEAEQSRRVQSEKEEDEKKMQHMTNELSVVEIAEKSRFADTEQLSRASNTEPTSFEDDLERDLRQEFEAQERMDEAQEAVGAMRIVDDGTRR